MFFTILNKKLPFQGRRTRGFKFQKLTFLERGQPMVLVQKWPFLGLFFLGDMGQEYVFYDILERKMSFQTIKRRSSKSRKIDIFLKRLTHGFGPKMAIFPILFLGNIGQENAFYDILERKIALLGQNNKKFKKSINSRFSKGVYPWFWSKNGHFCNFFFLGNIDQENVFYDILERKKCLSRL